MIIDDDITKADLTKLHSEVNQLRNQEFWVCSFAIAFFGATIEQTTEPIIGIGLLLVLLGLFGWHYTLTDARARLTTYLKTFNLSNWENHYRKLADEESFLSQRKAAVITFLMLGLVLLLKSILPFFPSIFQGYKNIEILSFTTICCLFGVVYLFIVCYFGFIKGSPKLEKYEIAWGELAEKNDWSIKNRISKAEVDRNSAEKDS